MPINLRVYRHRRGEQYRLGSLDHKTYIREICTSLTDMKSDDATAIIMAGGTLYFVGCVGLFTNWNSFHLIDVTSSVTSGLGLLTTCFGILLIDDYRLFKAFALICIALILAFGISWIAHLSAL